MAFARVVPHQDGAGVIEAVGEGVDAARVGERVWVYEATWNRPSGTAAEYTRGARASGGAPARTRLTSTPAHAWASPR